MPTNDPYKSDSDRYMRDVEAYLGKVQRGRSVRKVDPNQPYFSQEADDARLAARGKSPAGYGSSAKPIQETEWADRYANAPAKAPSAFDRVYEWLKNTWTHPIGSQEPREGR